MRVVLLAVLVAAALTVDVPRAGLGIKGDEATYVSAALSVAFDHDLAFERRDLERFTALYASGPQGIFLKRGKTLSLETGPPMPFFHLVKRDVNDPSRLYFGKALLYPLLAAPFVRLFGLNGLLVFNVLLLGLVAAAARRFLDAQTGADASAVMTAAFLGASVLPVYAVVLMPEILTFALVFSAYFLWAYKEVAPASRLRAGWTDLAAAALIGVASYAKPIPVPLLILPPILFACARRRWRSAAAIALVSAASAASLFALTAAVSGEFNYQGGDRKVFYGRFPFDAADATWDQRGGGVIEEPGPEMAAVLSHPDRIRRLAANVGYFVAGRYTGFLPYFFPGVVAIALWLASPQRRDRWRLLIAAAFPAGVLALLLALPFTWNGGGGSPGDRYALTLYATLFFLVPPGTRVRAGIIAAVGGALVTARMVVTPFATARDPWTMVDSGPARVLPVELAMIDDLSIAVAQPPRAKLRYQFGGDTVLLTLLDHHAWPPEPDGFWLSAAGRAEIVVGSSKPLRRLSLVVQSPIATRVELSMGGGAVSLDLDAGESRAVQLKARGTRGRREAPNEYLYLFTGRATPGFTPHLLDPASRDMRYLGAQVRFVKIEEEPVVVRR